MALSFGILLGLIAVLCWGFADFFVASLLKRKEVLPVLFWSQLLGFVLFAGFAIFSNVFFVPAIDLLLVLFFVGLLSAVSYVFLYRALKFGHVSVVMPLYSCWALVTMLLSIVFFGEKLSLLQFVGAFLAIVGAVLSSFKLSDLLKVRLQNFAAGANFAFVAMLGFGVFFAAYGFLISKIGWLLTLVFAVGFRVFFFGVFSIAGEKNNFSFSKGGVVVLLLAVGLLEFFATTAYSVGVTTELSAIVAPVSSVSPIVTIFLAKLFFKEKSEFNQKIGIVSVFVGLLLLAIA
jgi:drug/metabolite transporter (DMT)-like permease